MLLVKTRLGMSPIEGMGVFADEMIPKGTATWKFMPDYDLLMSKEKIANAPEPVRTALLRYSYLDSKTGLYIYCIDNARFVNHSPQPNIQSIDLSPAPNSLDQAIRDINFGEKLSCDYRQLDAAFDAKFQRRK